MAQKEAIVRQVRAVLEREPRINLHRYPIKIDVSDSAVILEGDVEDVAAKKLALQLAGSINGIRGVVDRIHIVPTEQRGDAAIRDALCGLLLQAPELRNCTIRVHVKGRVETLRDRRGGSGGVVDFTIEKGVITLEGVVTTLSDKRMAGALAWWAPGCRDVVNALEVMPLEQDNDAEVVDALMLVLEMDPLVHAEGVIAQAHNRVVTLKGCAQTEQERQRAELDAWALFAVDKVVNNIEVRA